MALAIEPGDLECTLCMSFYTDPVMLRCGHYFCYDCIENELDIQDRSEFYTCPECRKHFTERPVLQKNQNLCNKVNNSLQAESVTTIFCTYCVQERVPASKTCLLCEAFLCDIHLRVHCKSEQHVLTDLGTSWKNRKCSIHNRLFEHYCIKDSSFICLKCSASGDHIGHKLESLNDASKKKKEKYKNLLEKMSFELEETKKSVQNLQDHNEEMLKQANNETAKVMVLFSDIRQKLEDLQDRLLSELNRQKEQIIYPISERIKHLEKKMEKQIKTVHYIENLCKIVDPIKVLQIWDTHNGIQDAKQWCDGGSQRGDSTVYNPGGVNHDLISVNIYIALSDIINDVKTRRSGYGQEASDILLDICTASYEIGISDDLKTAYQSLSCQQLPETLDRFKDHSQVLSTKSFTSGKKFWEVEISDSGIFRLGVAYPSIERRGRQSCIGNNNKSWCLLLCNKNIVRIHNSQVFIVPGEYSCRRFGIYLDYEAGRLSFFELCESIRHLHTFTATFTEPLYAAFWVSDKGWLRIGV
ncbi:E3 ubiquitin/ISG15 ligase TRIM25-like [Bombina bombina]|uniref:E3 ubiquitin/ISG15 ligase TRIM25-like n=1 Tax=Bombina bombina TaxID=8345 RepID=UPI00235A5AE3|nr:E3 ubiquitin/ISG15 ligase TRIM25-like [Bombina bombina]